MAFHPQPSYLPHSDFDPAYGPTYPAQPYSQHPQHPQHQQPPYHPSYHPHPGAAFSQQPHQLPEPNAQRSYHAPHQHQQLQMPNLAHGHGPPPPGSMPPPSSIPENSLYRQNYAYASPAPRTPDRWPLGTTDDQRQMQEQYRQQGKQSYQRNEPALQAHQLTSITSSPAQTPQHHPNYLPQPSPISSVTPAGPVSSFPPTTQTRSPPQVQPPPQSPRIVSSPPSTPSQPSQQPMTTTTAKTLPESTSPLPTPVKEPANPASSAPVSVSLESQRVSALLELNRVLIQEVVTLQESQKESKAGTPAPQTQQTPQHSSPPSAIEASTSGAPHSKLDPANPAKEEGETNTNTNNDTSASTTTKPAQAQPPQQNRIPNSKEYIGYMRRLQANLAYLASVADRHHKPGSQVPQFPAIMEAPDTAEGGGEDNKGGKENMKELYAKLRDLWPEYVKGKANTPGSTAVATTTTTTTPTAISAPATSTTATTAAA